jgi:hypothetical protein
LQTQGQANQTAQYKGALTSYGAEKDPLVGAMLGGISTVGGGLPLYGEVNGSTDNTKTMLIGGLGVSGDSPCTNHAVAWAVRSQLKLAYFPATVTNTTAVTADGTKPDNIILDPTNPWGHPKCKGSNVVPTAVAQ